MRWLAEFPRKLRVYSSNHRRCHHSLLAGRKLWTPAAQKRDKSSDTKSKSEISITDKNKSYNPKYAPNSTPSSPSSATGPNNEEKPMDASMPDMGRLLHKDFATFQDHYSVPKHPIVLAHGLMGFDELRLAGSWLPGVQYWRGIKQAFNANGIQVITTTVPTTGSIAERAEALMNDIKSKLPHPGAKLNIIAHSMGGLDSRYLISNLRPNPQTDFKVASLTTIATPHRGSSAADMILREIGPDYLPRLYSLLARMNISTGAFSQLTRQYVTEEFNPHNKDDDTVRYFSYGASARPSIFSVFRISHDLMEELEGPNDGLVSVQSSKWPALTTSAGGEKLSGMEEGRGDGYKGTLMGCTHLDVINWTNRLKRLAASMYLIKQDFNAVAFYMHIADMLAKEGL